MLGHAFAIHNEYGRLLDESLYKTELAHRCLTSGLAVAREVLIRVRHGVFSKDYFIDLLLDDSTITEGKCAQSLLQSHRGQALTYLLMAGVHHGSLVNFRPLKVQREFVSTQLTLELRRRFELSAHSWPDDSEHRRLREIAVAFCSDVGLGLDVTLYRQAFTTLMGGHSVLPQTVPILAGPRIIGQHSLHLVRESVGLAVTAASKIADTRHHLQRLLNNTALEGIAWVNLPLNEVRLEFLKRQNHGGQIHILNSA